MQSNVFLVSMYSCVSLALRKVLAFSYRKSIARSNSELHWEKGGREAKAEAAGQTDLRTCPQDLDRSRLPRRVGNPPIHCSSSTYSSTSTLPYPILLYLWPWSIVSSGLHVRPTSLVFGAILHAHGNMHSRAASIPHCCKLKLH